MAIKKSNVIKFIESINDCEEIEKIYIESGIKKDYISISYYDNNEHFNKKSRIYEKERKKK